MTTIISISIIKTKQIYANLFMGLVYLKRGRNVSEKIDDNNYSNKKKIEK